MWKSLRRIRFFFVSNNLLCPLLPFVYLLNYIFCNLFGWFGSSAIIASLYRYYNYTTQCSLCVSDNMLDWTKYQEPLEMLLKQVVEHLPCRQISVDNTMP